VPTNPEPGGSVPTGVARPQPLSPRCWRCSSDVAPGAAFCQSCGADLSRAGGHPAVAPPPQARLIVIAQDGTPGKQYPVVGGQLDIGRESGGIVLSDDPYVCPRHARISWKNGRFYISDLGSVNGVFARLTAAESLTHGDLVLTGLQVLRFETVAPEEQAQAQAMERGTRLFGSPATPRYARLVQRTVEGIARDVFHIHKTQTTIGRETGDLVFTDDPFMSRQHAVVNRLDNGHFTLDDLGSSNGTFIAIRNERRINDGDYVRIGQHLFQLRVDG
jgi:pSer/pThr/pTyr-binding forkhead associated (FHA) protein